VRIGRDQDAIYSVRIPAGDADLLLGCDMVVAASNDALAKLNRDRSHAIINDYQSATSDFIFNKDYQFPADDMKQALVHEVGEEKASFVNATNIARQLLGDSIAGNLFLLGYAYQQGLVPVSAEAIEQAIELNNVAVDMNRQAFVWGRVAAAEPEFLERQLPDLEQEFQPLTDLDEIIQWRFDYLVQYQDKAYARRYTDLVEKVSGAEQALLQSGDKAELKLTEAVARSYFKLLAYKDEYEVARLYTQTDFRDQLRQHFSGDYKVNFQFAPPIFAKKDKTTGHLKKREFGPWVWPLLKVVARLKFLRKTPWDPLGRTAERKLDRELIADFETRVERVLQLLEPNNHALAVEIAALPQTVRGFGHIKERAAQQYRRRSDELMTTMANPEENVVRFVDRVA